MDENAQNGPADHLTPGADLPADVRLGRLKDRWEFLRVAGGRRKWAAKGLVLQAAPYDRRVQTRLDADPRPAQHRFGLTASKKVGNAVARNRARRRLRALAQEVLPTKALPRHDYVLIARGETVVRPYADLKRDLVQALKRTKTYRGDDPTSTGGA